MSSPRSRLAAYAVSAAALAGLAVAGASSPDEADARKAPRLITAHRITAVQCVPSVNGNARARVRLWMRVVNHHGWADWADRMEAKARLESTAPGLNIHSNWAKSKTPYLLQDRKHTYNFNLLTDNKRSDASWRVHVQLIWHRPAPVPNVKKDVYLRFDASCGLTAAGPGWAPGVT